MKILSVTINNFLTIGHAELSLDSKGLVLVQGSNLDDASAVSNGAGKSSIPDAICWALYGTTARGVSSDDVINEVAKKECFVSVNVEDGDDLFIIARHRKHTAFKNTSVVTKVRKSDGAVTDLSKGTDKETQEVINAIMGCDLDVFTSSVYAAQEMMPNLPGMTDKSLKQLIEASSGTERLSRAYETARDALVNATRRQDTAETMLNSAQSKVTMAKQSIDETNDEYAEADKKKTAAIQELSDKDSNGFAEIMKLKAQLDGMGEAGLVLKKTELETEISTHSKYDVELKRLDKISSDVAADYRVEKRRFDELVTFHDTLTKRLASTEELVGTPCQTCGKPYCEEDLESVKESKVKELDDATKELAVKGKLVSKLKAKIDDTDLEIKNYKATIPDVTQLTAEYKKVVDELAAINNLRTKIILMTEDVKNTRKALDDLTKSENPFKATLARWTKELEIREDAVVQADAALIKAREDVEIAKAVSKVFSPAGVRARILDTVTPYLNARTSDYLGALSDGNISAVWTTIQRTKSGELREKFGIDVTNDKGAKMFAGLSGGEKRKVRLACALALQDLVSSRATKSINLFIGDEIDDALDSAGLERLMGILEAKARERGTVLVISHENLSDWIDDVAIVEKKGGVSTVTGVLCK